MPLPAGTNHHVREQLLTVANAQQLVAQTGFKMSGQHPCKYGISLEYLQGCFGQKWAAVPMNERQLKMLGCLAKCSPDTALRASKT